MSFVNCTAGSSYVLQATPNSLFFNKTANIIGKKLQAKIKKYKHDHYALA